MDSTIGSLRTFIISEGNVSADDFKVVADQKDTYSSLVTQIKSDTFTISGKISTNQGTERALLPRVRPIDSKNRAALLKGVRETARAEEKIGRMTTGERHAIEDLVRDELARRQCVAKKTRTFYLDGVKYEVVRSNNGNRLTCVNTQEFEKFEHKDSPTVWRMRDHSEISFSVSPVEEAALKMIRFEDMQSIGDAMGRDNLNRLKLKKIQQHPNWRNVDKARAEQLIPIPGRFVFHSSNANFIGLTYNDNNVVRHVYVDKNTGWLTTSDGHQQHVFDFLAENHKKWSGERNQGAQPASPGNPPPRAERRVSPPHRPNTPIAQPASPVSQPRLETFLPLAAPTQPRARNLPPVGARGTGQTGGSQYSAMPTVPNIGDSTTRVKPKSRTGEQAFAEATQHPGHVALPYVDRNGTMRLLISIKTSTKPTIYAPQYVPAARGKAAFLQEDNGEPLSPLAYLDSKGIFEPVTFVE